jgi:hypothetical protein
MALVLLVSGVIGEGEMMTGAWIAGYLISSAASVRPFPSSSPFFYS